VGGYSGGSISSVEIVDLTGNHPGCFPTADFPIDIFGAVGAYVEGRVLVCGGDSGFDYEQRCWSYDSVNDDWDEEVDISLTRGRRYAAASLTAPDEWIITGGEDTSWIYSFELYRDGHFETGVIPNDEGISGHCLVRISPTELLLIGGASRTAYLADVWHYNFQTDIWTAREPMPTSRCLLSCGVVRRKNDATGLVETEVVAVGGYTSSYIYSKVEIYSVANDEWRESPTNFPVFVSNAEVIQFGETFMVVGGYDEQGDDYLPSIFQVAQSKVLQEAILKNLLCSMTWRGTTGCSTAARWPRRGTSTRSFQYPRASANVYKEASECISSEKAAVAVAAAAAAERSWRNSLDIQTVIRDFLRRA